MAYIWTQALVYLSGLLDLLAGVFFGNYILAIIALTVLLRLILLPATFKQTVSMKEIQKIQPIINKIKEKYKDDQKKQGEEIMKAYKEHNFNPLGGCLPMLVQLPMFFALFRVLNGFGKPAELVKKKLISVSQVGILAAVTKGMSQSIIFGAGLNASLVKALFGGKAVSFGALIPAIKTLTASSVLGAMPYILLVVAMIAGQAWSNKVMLDEENPQQAHMMNMMLIFFIFIGFTLPAGVIIYWTVTSVLTGLQHVLTIKYLESKEAAKA